MNAENTKTVITYVLSYDGKDTRTIDFLLQSTHGAWIDIIVQEPHGVYPRQKLYSASLDIYSPSLRHIEVEDNTTFSLYVKDHWYILGGAICQFGWSSAQKRMELFTLCSSHLELVEIDKLPWTLEEERAELAKKYAYDRLSAQNRVLQYPSLEVGELVYDRIEVVQSEEVNVDFLGTKEGRVFNREAPERSWIMAFLYSSSEKETQALKCYVLVDYYRSRPHFACYLLTKSNGTFSVEKGC